MSKTSLIFFKNSISTKNISSEEQLSLMCSLVNLKCKISVIDIKKVELYMTDEATKVVFYS